MLGYVVRNPKRSGKEAVEAFSLPPDLRHRLRDWIDVDEIGPEGFWIWFRAVLPLLPRPSKARSRLSALREAGLGGDFELRRRLMDYARDRARLVVICDRYTRENDILSRRLRALEAALRTFEHAGLPVDIPSDEEATAIVAGHLDRPRSGPEPTAAADPPSDRSGGAAQSRRPRSVADR